MTKYIDPKLSQESLETYQGYSLQVFTSGRIKLSVQIAVLAHDANPTIQIKTSA